jgi:hypothetical protein
LLVHVPSNQYARRSADCGPDNGAGGRITNLFADDSAGNSAGSSAYRTAFHRIAGAAAQLK